MSYEALLSGPGLTLLHQCLAEVEGLAAPARTAAAILADADADALCGRTVELFCAALGAFAGDLALIFGARGGVYVAGGVAARMQRFLQAGAFRQRFEAKAPHQAYVARIPTRLVTDPYVALRGAARTLVAP